ncbi:MAG: hypothetical protein GX564_13720 [Oligosphaeraceae bacterium]|nr:hypothetical protein [Oligosphaeraceae bacterium]
MPGDKTHQQLTAEALSLSCCSCRTGRQELIRQYCLYPDLYYCAPEQTEEYNFFFEGIQFHYPPNVPYVDLYRYWQHRPGGGLKRTRRFQNNNFRHVDAGFRHYLQAIADCWRRHEDDRGCRFLGGLLHFLQDSIFGMHALEGPGGADLFVLDRLSGEPQLERLTGLPCPENAAGEYRARVLGASVDEAVARLYAEYVRATNDSRHCLFRLLFASAPADDPPRQMAANAVRLCADTIATLEHLAGLRPASFTQTMPLTIFEPFEFPLGGSGKYRFLSLCQDQHSLSFWAHYDTRLLYALPQNIFAAFSAELQFVPAAPLNRVKIKMLNDHHPAEQFTLSALHPSRKITLVAPGGVCGLQIIAAESPGEIILHSPTLQRRD